MNDLISRQAERMSELKPCPFCGAPAVHWEWNGGARVDCSKWMSDGAAVNTHFVGIGAKTFEEAAKLWNERKDAQPERKKDIIQKFHDYQVEWLTSHCDLELEPVLEGWVVRFLHDTANCFMMEMEGEHDV